MARTKKCDKIHSEWITVAVPYKITYRTKRDKRNAIKYALKLKDWWVQLQNGEYYSLSRIDSITFIIG